MTEILIKKLAELEIDMRYMRGQGYDNGSNMKVFFGVQKRTRDINSRAFYVPCTFGG